MPVARMRRDEEVVVGNDHQRTISGMSEIALKRIFQFQALPLCVSHIEECSWL